jgi:FkbM family methyltransferase
VVLDEIDGMPDFVLAGNEHGIYCVPCTAEHRLASLVVMNSRVWEARTINLLREVDPTADLIHAGAFFGDFIPALARSRQAGGMVWAFEPSRENYRCAQMTSRLNDLHNVALFHAALGEGAGTAVLATSTAEGVPLGGGSRIVEKSKLDNGQTSEEVGVLAIDDVVGISGRRIGAIQLDVEGQERQVLAGGMKTIERCRPLLILEKLPEAGWMADSLEPLGYRLTGEVCGNSVLTC